MVYHFHNFLLFLSSGYIYFCKRWWVTVPFRAITVVYFLDKMFSGFTRSALISDISALYLTQLDVSLHLYLLVLLDHFSSPFLTANLLYNIVEFIPEIYFCLISLLLPWLHEFFLSLHLNPYNLIWCAQLNHNYNILSFFPNIGRAGNFFSQFPDFFIHFQSLS